MSTRDLTPDEQALLTAGASMWATAELPGTPRFTMADGPMGIASGRVDERDVSILTPCPAALGASWDADLVRRVGALVGGDAVQRGVDAVLAPNVNLARSPLAGRAFEYFSEDPLLTGTLGTAWAMGVQSTGTGAVVKHLVCNDSETLRDRMNVVVDERTLREVYLLPFEMAAEAGCVGMLAAYNKVNGAWCAEQHHVLTEIVKQEWGFTGVLMSDWFGTHSTVGSMRGGLDLEMPGPPRFLGPKLAEAVALGAVEAGRVADAAGRVALAAQRLRQGKSVKFDGAAGDELLIEAAAAGFTLLKNDGDLLPLAPHQTIAVIGPNAQAPCFQGGTFAKIAVKPDAVLPLDAIRARFGDHCTIEAEPGVDPQPRLPAMPVTALDGARGMSVEYFDNPDCQGAPVATETRDTNSLVWFVGVHDHGVFDRPASIRASGWYVPTHDGVHRLYLGGTGAVRLLVDDAELLRSGTPVAASDVMGKLKSGDADEASIELRAGQRVRITVEFRYQVARVQGLWYGLRGPDSAEAMLERAVALAARADAVVLLVGETSDSSVESKDRPDTQLPAAQLRLIELVCAVNKRTAIVANVGHGFNANFAAQAAALMVVWYPGQEFGRALAQVLAGDREPGGRLPVTLAANEADYPALCLTPAPNGDLAYSEGALIGYRGLKAKSVAPLHGFGSGFGYARFEIGDVAVENDAVTASVRNLSDRAGAEVVQLYRAEPEFTLIGFAKIHLPPHASQRVRIPLPRRRFEVWQDGWRPIGGKVTLLVGRSAEEIVSTISWELPR